MADTQTSGVVSLEVPTMVHANGAAPVLCMIEQLRPAECRMRSVNPFDVGTHVDFTVAIFGAPTIPLQGKVLARDRSGSRFVYTVALEPTADQGEAILRATQVARSRSDAAHAPDIQTNNGLTRASVRVPVDFEFRYTKPGEAPRTARATNVSLGGILLNTNDEMPVGSALELELPLGTDRVRVRGRVVAHQAASPNYNIAFYQVEAETHEKLVRFVESRQR